MVIEFIGVQFGLKSTATEREFDLKSQVWFQTKITRHEIQLLVPLYYSHVEIAKFSRNHILLIQ